MRKAVRIVVKVDADTFAWLTQLAKQTEHAPAGAHSQAQLLAQAAFCFADAAGRRPGSWEAEVGRQMLRGSGLLEG